MERVRYIDVLKGLAIIFIINVHIPIPYRPFVNGVTFHVTSFFTATGLIYAYKSNIQEYKIKDIAKKRFFQILKPYFIVSIIWIVVNTIFLFTKKYSVKYIIVEELGNLYKTFSFTGIGVLWFLPTLFFAEIIFVFYLKKRNGIQKLRFFTIVIITGIMVYVLYETKIIGKLHTDVLVQYRSFFYNEIILFMQTLVAAIFMCFGYMIGSKIEKLVKSPFKLLCLTIIGFIMNYILSYKQPNDLHYVNISNIFIYFMTSFIGTFSLILLALLLSQYKYIAAYLSWLGTHTLVIMATHNECGLISLSLFILSALNLIGDNFLVKLSVLGGVLLLEFLIVLLVKNTFLKNVFYAKEGAYEV